MGLFAHATFYFVNSEGKGEQKIVSAQASPDRKMALDAGWIKG